jgi:Holliday junction resolvase
VTPEAKVKRKVRLILDALGIYNFMPPANGYGRAGIPDIVGCYNGRFIAIECKAGKGTLTELQKRELERIKDACGLAYVINESNVDQLKELITNETDSRG